MEGNSKMNSKLTRRPLYIFFISIVTYMIAYYACILLHEWMGHGLAAWLLGQKSSPFDITYGGWALFHVDENVDYNMLEATNQHISAAIIAINAVIVTSLLLVVSLILLPRSKIQKHTFIFTLLYWALVINVIPLLQYFTLTAFSNEGDVGHFTHGLNISPWWIFIPGTIAVILALWRIFSIEIIRAYAVIPINNLWGRRLFLSVTLFTIFLFIYAHGYNPLTDTGTNLPSKILAVISILVAPILFLICDPSRNWVKTALRKFRKPA